MSLGRRLLLVLLLVDAVLLGVLELFFLPLRLPAEQGGYMLPVSLLLAALTMPLLVRAAADLGTGLAVAGAPLATWLVTVLALGVLGPGGDSLLPGDLRPIGLLAAGVIPSAVVLGRLATEAVERAVRPPGTPAAATAPAAPASPAGRSASAASAAGGRADRTEETSG